MACTYIYRSQARICALRETVKEMQGGVQLYTNMSQPYLPYDIDIVIYMYIILIANDTVRTCMYVNVFIK